ncbi:MAG: DUF882 domain-containing protein [Gammaproteobacteria bacterium]|nr:MAG: DUF882 domain-containing protein [Gammaproteobacteria bacterium]
MSGSKGSFCSGRRGLLAGMGSLLFLGAVPGALAAAREPRLLRFHHTHTAERLTLEYHDGHGYLPDALAEAARFLRDFRTGEVHPVDRGLFDILWSLDRLLETGARPWQVISGYRSPATNDRLRRRSKGVARRSLHMEGKAIDVRLEGIPTRTLYRAGLSLRCGGVGCYSRSRFVHLDTGRVRTWGS